MKIRPLADKVLVLPDEPERKTPGGLHLPEGTVKRPRRGKVLAIGFGAVLENGNFPPLQVRTGDCVLYTQYAGTEVNCDGKELLIMSESDILAIVD